jgi:8-oxo-dGTP pyrophosphatase MutT (NUDIX family)
MRRVVRTFLIDKEWKYLLVKHHKSWTWVLPGGHIEDWESIYKTLKREILEELNLEIEILWNKVWLDIEYIKEKPLPLCIYKIEYSDRKQEERKKLEYIFLSKIKSGELKCQKDEICDYKFFTKEEVLKEENVYPQIKNIIKTINT